MSDGTRDQLYLAFRLASLENHAASTEPLPFVADDILVHFDDPRSVATLDLLAKFGETNQVLLFTHHERIRDAGAEGYVSKPISVLRFVEAVRALLEAAAARAEEPATAEAPASETAEAAAPEGEAASEKPDEEEANGASASDPI